MSFIILMNCAAFDIIYAKLNNSKIRIKNSQNIILLCFRVDVEEKILVVVTA